MGRRDDASGFLPLHPMEFRILLALLDGPSYGTAIVEEIEAREGPGARLYPANVFRRMRDLIAKGLLEPCTGPEGADPRRGYLRLSRSGRAVARAEARRMQGLVEEATTRRLLPGG